MKEKTTTNNFGTLNPNYSNAGILDTIGNEIFINCDSRKFLPSTSIFATVEGEVTDIINIKDTFNHLPQQEKLKIISVLLEWCSAETSKLTYQNK